LPVDLVDAGGGELLVLLRRLVWMFPPGFDSAIGVLRTADLQPGAKARVRIIARLEAGFPKDNYEGIAITEDPDGRHVWLISDDNRMSYQRTLLLKLEWAERPERQKARE